MKKRILITILSICMIFVSVPVEGFAQERNIQNPEELQIKKQRDEARSVEPGNEYRNESLESQNNKSQNSKARNEYRNESLESQNNKARNSKPGNEYRNESSEVQNNKARNSKPGNEYRNESLESQNNKAQNSKAQNSRSGFKYWYETGEDWYDESDEADDQGWYETDEEWYGETDESDDEDWYDETDETDESDDEGWYDETDETEETDEDETDESDDEDWYETEEEETDESQETEQKITQGSCGKNLIWTLLQDPLTEEYDTLRIQGSGDMEDYVDPFTLLEHPDMQAAPWAEESLVHVELPVNLTHLGNYAFEGQYLLEEINLGTTKVKDIGDSALSNCMTLKEVTIPATTEAIGSYAFEGCSSLEILTIPDSVKTIGENAFWSMQEEVQILTSYRWYSADADLYELAGDLDWMPALRRLEPGDPLPQKPESIQLNRKKVTLYIGDSIQLKEIVFPENAVYSQIFWSSSQEMYVTVDQTGMVSVIGYTDQPITITASLNQWSATCEVTLLVSDVELQGDHLDANGKLRSIPEGVWVAGFQKEGLVYTGSTVKQNFRVYDHHKLLKEKKDYTITYKNAIEAAPYGETSKSPTVVVTMKGSYQGTMNLFYEIKPVELTQVQLVNEGKALNYNGKIQYAKPVLTNGTRKLVEKKDYRIQYQVENPIGTPDGITRIAYNIEGMGNYTGELTDLCYYITGKTANLSKATVTMKHSKIKFYGEAVEVGELGLTIKLPDTREKVDPTTCEDLIVTILDPMTVSKQAVVRIEPSETGKERFAGVIEKKFEIEGGIDLKKDVTWNSFFDWTTPLVYDRTIADNGGMTLNTTDLLSYGSLTLQEGQDYTVTYGKNRNVGTASITFQGVGKYRGKVTKHFKIIPDTTLLVMSQDMVKYTTGGTTPELKVYDYQGNLLQKKKDYKVTFSNNKKIGDGTYRVTGLGNYKGASETGIFQIIEASLQDCTVVLTDKTFSNKKSQYEAKPVITDTNGKKLVAGRDYEKKCQYVYPGQENHLPPAVGETVTVTITGKGSYEGTEIKGTYHIYDKKKNISKLYLTIDPKDYTGEAIELSLNQDIHVYLTAKDQKNKTNEQKAEDYIRIDSYGNHTKMGIGKVTLQGVGEYGSTRTVSFSILQKKVPEDCGNW